MFLKARDVGLLKGFQASPKGLGFPILQFENDTLVLVNDDLDTAKEVRNSIIWFETISSLKVNTSKTVLFQVNMEKDWEQIVSLWTCK